MPYQQVLKTKVTPAPANTDDEYQDEVANSKPESAVPQPQVYDDTEQYASQPRTTGFVKWFDDKRGIGFITIIAGEHRNTDVFVHQTNVRPHLSNYRTLTAGEYVDFVYGEADNSNDTNRDHNHQALYVTGIMGGALMCDNNSHRRNPLARRNYQGGSHNHDGGNKNYYGGHRNNRSDGDDDFQGVGSRGRVVTAKRS